MNRGHPVGPRDTWYVVRETYSESAGLSLWANISSPRMEKRA